MRGVGKHLVERERGIPFSSFVAGLMPPSSRFARRNEDFTPDVGSINRIIWIGYADDDLNLYLIDGDGDIFMVLPSS